MDNYHAAQYERDHAERLRTQLELDRARGLRNFTGGALVVHAIWAATIVAVTWIIKG